MVAMTCGIWKRANLFPHAFHRDTPTPTLLEEYGSLLIFLCPAQTQATQLTLMVQQPTHKELTRRGNGHLLDNLPVPNGFSGPYAGHPQRQLAPVRILFPVISVFLPRFSSVSYVASYTVALLGVFHPTPGLYT